MGLDLVPTGKNPPDEINVIIEIPKDAEPVKYEVDKASGAIFVDRVLSTPMRYPCNYGYVPHTLCGDGDPADVLVLMPLQLIPGSVIRVRPVGVLRMRDEAGSDEKILAVPVTKVYPGYAHIEGLNDVRSTGATASPTSSSTTRTWNRASGSSSTAGATRPKPSRSSSTRSCATTKAKRSRTSKCGNEGRSGAPLSFLLLLDDRQADQARHHRRDVAHAGDLLQHHQHARRRRSPAARRPGPSPTALVKLRNSNSSHVRSRSGSKPVKLPGYHRLAQEERVGEAPREQRERGAGREQFVRADARVAHHVGIRPPAA